MQNYCSFAALVFLAILGIGGVIAYALTRAKGYLSGRVALVSGIVIASVAASSMRVADQWNKAVVLRLGKFRALQGPGLFYVIPIVDDIPYWVDTRLSTSELRAEETLTKDTVPVNLHAVVYWKVEDPRKAVLNVADYRGAAKWAFNTSLRDAISRTLLFDLLETRDKFSAELQMIIEERTRPCGVNVLAVNVKDLIIPAALVNAMSMQAQAERERQARLILGDAERQMAWKFSEAAKTYSNNPIALRLRTMNLLCEGLMQNAVPDIGHGVAGERM